MTQRTNPPTQGQAVRRGRPNRPPDSNHPLHQQALTGLWQAQDACAELDRELEDHREDCEEEECYLCLIYYEASGARYVLDWLAGMFESIAFPSPVLRRRHVQELTASLKKARRRGDRAKVDLYTNMLAAYAELEEGDRPEAEETDEPVLCGGPNHGD